MNINKNKINRILNPLLIIIECGMIVSIVIFLFFVAKGYFILGHIPFYGDKEVISFNGFDRILSIVMMYPMFYGIFLWIVIMIIQLILALKRKRKLTIIGFILCLINYLIMFTSQFEWILD